MIKDIVFVLMVLSMTVYAHANKSEIMNFMQTYEMEKEFIEEELKPVAYAGHSLN